MTARSAPATRGFGDLPGDLPGDPPGDLPGDPPGDLPGDLPGDPPGDPPMLAWPGRSFAVTNAARASASVPRR